MWRYKNEWQREGWYESKGVNTDENYVWAKITSFGVFAPLEYSPPPPPKVSIIKPRNYIYINDIRIIPWKMPVIIGKITVTVEENSSIGINRVEFYIDNSLKSIDTSIPYFWVWNEFARGMHEIKVIAYDNIEQKTEEIVKVSKIF